MEWVQLMNVSELESQIEKFSKKRAKEKTEDMNADLIEMKDKVDVPPFK